MSPLDRRHFSPGHFTASGFVLSPDRASLLLIYHKKLELWLQPGGHFEPSDVGLEQAARREVGEETGVFELEVLEPLVDVDVHEIPQLGPEPPHLHHDLRVLFRALDVRLQPGDEVAQARWFPLSVLQGSPVVETDDSVRRVVRKLLEGGPGSL